MKPGAAAVCSGEVMHLRTMPTTHRFVHPVAQVWVDPDRPQELTKHHPIWSTGRWRPARVVASDYGSGTGSAVSLGSQVRADLASVLGYEPSGAVRMLTQPRMWGWLFNPITLFFAWDRASDQEGPVGAVLEVTNTPWKERHRYAVALVATDGGYEAEFPKVLHVSPFMDEDYRYDLRVDDDGEGQLKVRIDVRRPGDESAILRTSVQLSRVPATRGSLGHFLRKNVFSTHLVSSRIHFEAARLVAKRVPFVSHPRVRGGTCEPEAVDVAS
ncbi:MAG: DUF1365 domain-containing protein [Acidimicrobiales bacterium]